MKDNNTGKDKEFYSKGKQMFDEINTDWYPQDKDTNEHFAQRISLAEAYRCGVLAGAEAEREACAAMFDNRNVWDEEVGERIRARGQA